MGTGHCRRSARDASSFICHELLRTSSGAAKNDAALRGTDELHQIVHFGRREHRVLLDLRDRLGRIQFRLQQIAICALQLLDRVRSESASRQPDAVHTENASRPTADRAAEWQRIFGDDRIATEEAVTAHATELVYGGTG